MCAINSYQLQRGVQVTHVVVFMVTGLFHSFVLNKLLLTIKVNMRDRLYIATMKLLIKQILWLLTQTSVNTK